MTHAPGLYAVILAAGESTRMGTDKALLPWPPTAPGSPPTGQTFLSAAIQALEPFSETVIVVVGKNEDNLAPVVYATGRISGAESRARSRAVQLASGRLAGGPEPWPRRRHGHLGGSAAGKCSDLEGSVLGVHRRCERRMGGRSGIQRKARASFSGGKGNDRSFLEGSCECNRAAILNTRICNTLPMLPSMIRWSR